jgi:hypothetical protein
MARHTFRDVFSLKFLVFINSVEADKQVWEGVWEWKFQYYRLSPHIPFSVKDPLNCWAVYFSNRTRVLVRPSVFQ